MTLLWALLLIVLLRTFTRTPYTMPKQLPEILVTALDPRLPSVLRCTACQQVPEGTDTVGYEHTEDELPVDAFTRVRVGNQATTLCPTCLYALELALQVRRAGGR